jgi:hypothetical protein
MKNKVKKGVAKHVSIESWKFDFIYKIKDFDRKLQ